MKIEDKYLPTIDEQRKFLVGKIESNKSAIYGGVVEISLASANGEKRNVEVTEDMLRQLTRNHDILSLELAKLGEA